MFRRAALFAAIVALVSLRGPAAADPTARITVPLTIDYPTLDAALKRQIYDAPGGRAILWQGSNACEFLYAANPRFATSGAATVELESDGELGLGVPLADKCVNPISWKGIIAIDATPYLTPNLTLRFRVSDINLYDRHHHKSFIVGRGFDLIKGSFIPRFETFKFDLRPPIEEFRALAEAAAPPDQAERFRQTLATVHGVGPAIPAGDGVRITLGLTAPSISAAQPTAAAATLTPAELAAWDEQLDQWDAFIVFAIKQIGSTAADQQLRSSLLNLLLDGRYRLARAMDQPPAPGGPDPVRVLFLDQWRQLRDAVRAAAARGLLGDRALEFLSFVSAGDALMAFDQAAPALGARISAADLRRLARIMAPNTTADPLQFNYQEDPELQHIFGFTPPPMTPDSVEPSDSDQPEPAATAGMPGAGSAIPQATATPRPGVSDAPPTPAPPAAALPSGRSSAAPFTAPFMPMALSVRMVLRLIAPAEAFAGAPPQPDQLRQIGARLRRSVVNQNNVDRYTHDLGALLDAASASEITDEQPDPALRPTYRVMVRAAAWQESCWRQFVLARGRVRYLESSTHDIGLMQVNRYVWRGFYNLSHLEWDIAYNAGAGSQILARLMIRAAGKAQHANDSDALARSAYAAYNGGPDQLNRWRRADEPHDKRLIDEAFWQKYQALGEGQSVNILKCEAEWGHAPGH
ncbi:MAG TPA: lytic transglycosylase domain-containing protein [Candidatus Binataceae bacterium]|nr:lytic transglycosylase domain-containing protein [Candidatus Binataceae bacterium]